MSCSPRGSRASLDILEELQLIAAQNLEKLDVNRYYEVVRELGKGTYGKVDLVVHRIRGKRSSVLFCSRGQGVDPQSVAEARTRGRSSTCACGFIIRCHVTAVVLEAKPLLIVFSTPPRPVEMSSEPHGPKVKSVLSDES